MHSSSDPSNNQSNTAATDKDRRENQRLAALDYLDAVRPEVDEVLQQLVDEVRKTFETDLCMINLILSDVQYFRAWSGELPEDLAEARQDPRERSMCQYVVETEKPLVVEDFLATEEFKDQYFRVNYGIRFYAGSPLVTSGGHVIGTLCLVGTQPKEISEEQMTLLGTFAKAVVGRLELLGALRREQAVREDEAQRSRELQHMLDSSRDVIATVGVDGRFKSMNRAVEWVLGYETEELIGHNYLDLVHPDDRDLSTKLTGAIEDGTRETRFDNRCLRKDGGIVCIEWNVTAIPEEGVVHCVARDVTERKRAELAVRENEKRFRQLFNQSVDALFIHDASGKIVDCNEEACRSLGYTREELLSLRIRDLATDLVPDEDKRSRTEPTLWQRALSGQPGKVAGVHEGEHRRKGGTTFPVEVYVGSVDYGGEQMIFASARDITERKRAEAELRASEAELRALFGAMDDVILVFDSQGRYLKIAPTNPLFLYKPPEDLIGKTLHEVFPQEQADAFLERIRQALETQQPVNMEYSLPIGEEEIWFDGSISPMLEDSIIFVARNVTERKRAEKVLEQQAEVLQEQTKMIDLAHDAILVRDVDSTIVQWNQGATEVYGWTKEEVVGKITHTLLQTSWPSSREAIDAVLLNEGRWEGELRHIRRDGTRIVVESRQVMVYNERSEPTAILEINRDVTERKQAEEEIRQLNETLEQRVEERTKQLESAVHEIQESEERYSLVVEGSNDGIWDWDIRTDELYWSNRLFEIFGLSSSEVTPTFELFAELLHPDDRQRVLDAVTTHLERNTAYSEEFQIQHSSGEYIYCISQGKAIRDEDGRPIRMAGAVTDITERKREEEALAFLAKASAELASSLDYHATLASVARLTVPHLADWCAVDVIEKDGSLNRLAVAHEDPEKVRWAHELQERYPPDPDAPYGVSNVLRTGEPEFVPEITETALDQADLDDEHREILRELGLKSCIVVPLIARGRTLGAITLVTVESGRRYGHEDLEVAEELARRTGLAVDNARLYEAARKELAERERAEQEIRKLNENLEKRVAERTEQLEEAREVAEAANRAKSEFLANMSHEIRTPMNGIIGMTELILDTELSDEQREYAETVRYSSETLLTVINDILDFSKVEAGKMSIEITDFNLQTVVEEVVGLSAERAQDKGLELASLVEYGLPTALRGDPVRLRQVLTNLTSNAIKFTEEGEVVLHVDLIESTDEAVVLRFEVTDSGIGITPNQRERLFQSFSQADASTTRRYGGTGLGLAISKRLVELMGGEIGVESEPGVGSTFWFTLPLAKQPEEAQPVPKSLIADLRELRVLIVDDNATNCRILNRQVAPLSMHSESAEDSPRALQILRAAAERNAPYDLAVLDMQMPGMDGMQLARTIKADPAISSTRLILLTSIGKRGDGEEAKEARIEAYLTKPVKQSELYDAIATIMGTSTETATPEDKQFVTRQSLREVKVRLLPHVLVAEDNAVNQKVATMMLERLGYRVDLVTTGIKALEALSHTTYAAVLMDVQMPEMDGYEATAEIRRREEREGRRTPIIAMTANAMQGDREKALEAGMDDYVSKPVKSEELDAVLERWISQSTATSSPEEETDGAATLEVNKAPLDQSILEGLRELGDQELLKELAELFLKEVPLQLEALREAIEGGDASSVERMAHTLKGSCGNMGVTRMSTICAELQEVGHSGKLVGATVLVERLEAEFGHVRPALEAEIEKS
ncbi:MAG: hypothetical protein QOI57_3055 [Rubrobacteraceae bacterium]|nr:hypothetical protein [Rubrobacteraceae bacterium]